MATKSFFLSLLLSSIIVAMAQAQYKTFFIGHVYTEDSISGKQRLVPFATLKFYELDTPDKIVATRITALNGSYDFRGFDTDKKYIIKINAPGIKEQSFVTIPNNGQVKSGNINAHAKLTIGKTYESPVIQQSYFPNEFTGKKGLTILEMVSQLPGLKIEHNEVVTGKEGSVRIMVNGVNVEAAVFNKMKKLPAAEAVKSMDYYDLSGFENSAYDGVLNIRLVAGDEAKAPTYKLVSLETYKK